MDHNYFRIIIFFCKITINVFPFSKLANGVCSKCVSGLYLTEESDNCVECKASNEYPSGSNDGTGRCNICSENCILCKNALSCQTCQQGFFLDQLGKCVACDQAGQYRQVTSENTGLCVYCVSNCFDCLNTKLCNTCKRDFYDQENGKFCVACDQKGQTKNGTNDGSGSCIECPVNCLNCADKEKCLACDKGFLLLLPNNKSCVSCSENGTISIKEGESSNCYDCGPNCQTCLSKDSCQTCVADFYLRDGKCIACDVEGFFPNKNTGYCDSCLQNCLKCSSASSCDMCSPGLFFNKNTKVCESCEVKQCKNCDSAKDLCNECYAGWAVENGIKCTACSTGSPNCQFCELKNVSACTQCEPMFSLVPVESKIKTISHLKIIN